MANPVLELLVLPWNGLDTDTLLTFLRGISQPLYGSNTLLNLRVGTPATVMSEQVEVLASAKLRAGLLDSCADEKAVIEAVAKSLTDVSFPLMSRRMFCVLMDGKTVYKKHAHAPASRIPTELAGINIPMLTFVEHVAGKHVLTGPMGFPNERTTVFNARRLPEVGMIVAQNMKNRIADAPVGLTAADRWMCHGGTK